MQVYLKSLNFMNNYNTLSDLSNLYRVVQHFPVKKKKKKDIKLLIHFKQWTLATVNFTSIAVFTLK